jgi:hypothetical protein
MRAPGLDGIGGVETEDGSEGSPEAIDVRLAEEALGPTCIRSRDARPVDFAARDQVVQLGDEGHQVAPEAGVVDAVEHGGIGVAEDRDHSALALDRFGHGAPEPVGDEADRVVRCVADARGLGRPVPVDDADVARARGVGGFRDRSCDLRLSRVPDVHEHVLARLQVDADADGELGQALQVVGHCAEPNAVARAGAARIRAPSARPRA